MQLGRAMKWSGRRSKVILGQNAVSVRWQVGLGGMIRGLEKNFFAGSNFRLVRVLEFLVANWVIGIAPFIGLFVGPLWSRVCCILGVGIMSLMLELMGKQSGIRWYHAALMPIGAIACMVALGRSTWITLVRGGVTWRGHLYPLRDLRQHVKQRETWMRELWLSTR